VVLAAGVGSRFGGLKQIEPMGPGGEAILDYSVYDALRAGIERIVVIVSPANQDLIKAHVDAGFGSRVDTRYAIQEPPPARKPWGTGQAVLTTRPYVDGSFAVVNGDDYYGHHSMQLVADELHRDDGSHVLVAFPLGDMLSPHGGVSRGICTVDADGNLVAIEETHGILETDIGVRFDGDEPVSANLWGFRPSIYDELQADFDAFLADEANRENGEFYIGATVARMLGDPTRAHTKVARTPDRWLGVTYRDDVDTTRRAIAAHVAAGVYPERLWT
jgi:hypothetical protein